MSIILSSSLTLFHYISSPVVNMHQEPEKNSEIVSQAYFSEQVTLLDETQDWVKVETSADGYQGWVQTNMFCQRDTPYLSEASYPTAKVNRHAAHLYAVQDTIYGPILTLPFDSLLQVIAPVNDPHSRWLTVRLVDGKEAYIQRGDVSFDFNPLNREEMCALSLEFRGLPYTWGGRSSFGYDCSGFVQMLYRQMNIYLPRDSGDQLTWQGLTPIAIEDLMPGDLVFFGLAENKIRHVGLSLGNDQFIHSTVAENAPYIRISRLSDPEWNGSGRYHFRAACTLRP